MTSVSAPGRSRSCLSSMAGEHRTASSSFQSKTLTSLVMKCCARCFGRSRHGQPHVSLRDNKKKKKNTKYREYKKSGHAETKRKVPSTTQSDRGFTRGRAQMRKTTELFFSTHSVLLYLNTFPMPVCYRWFCLRNFSAKSAGLSIQSLL